MYIKKVLYLLLVYTDGSVSPQNFYSKDQSYIEMNADCLYYFLYKLTELNARPATIWVGHILL